MINRTRTEDRKIPELRRTKRLNEKDFMKITRKQPEEATVLKGSRGELLVPGENEEMIDSETPHTARNWVQFKKKSVAKLIGPIQRETPY